MRRKSLGKSILRKVVVFVFVLVRWWGGWWWWWWWWWWWQVACVNASVKQSVGVNVRMKFTAVDMLL
jgi:hypothetical protein